MKRHERIIPGPVKVELLHSLHIVWVVNFRNLRLRRNPIDSIIEGAPELQASTWHLTREATNSIDPLPLHHMLVSIDA